MQRTFPLVSVITPTFNRAHSLQDCLHSILSQSWTNIEAIVVDDGSTDGTRSLVESMQQHDSRIRYLHQANQGVSAARNTGLRAARGEFLALLDSDDLWRPDKLAHQMAALQALPDVGMIWSDMAAIDSQGRVLHERYLRKMYGGYQRLGDRPLFPENLTLPAVVGGEPGPSVQYGTIYSQMLYGNLVHTSTVLLRRERAEAVGLFDEALRRGGEDYVFHLKTCRLGPVAFLDVPAILYRIGCADQITADRRNQVEFATAFLETIRSELTNHAEQIDLSAREINEILYDAHTWLGSELRRSGQTGAALSQLLQAIRRRPAQRYAWMQLARTLVPAPLRDVLRKVTASRKSPHPSLA